MAKKVIPPIHASIQEENGSVAWAWYLFFQWLADNAGKVDLSDYFTKEETEELLSAKADADDLKAVAFTGDYDDLTNKPIIPAAQVNSDWNATSGVAEILNKPTIPVVNDATLTITQGGVNKGTFTANAGSDVTIDLDAGGSDGYHPDLFDWKWADHELDDVQWLRADTSSWQAGSVYEAAYKHLRNDMYQWYSWEYDGTTIYTKKRYPEVGEKAYDHKPSSPLAQEVGEITAIDSGFDNIGITVNGNHYDGVTGASVTPTAETIAGVTVNYIPAEDGHKIVTSFHTTEVDDVYSATGVAWYYILDTTNTQFKLPRTKFGVTGLRDTVGNYVAPGLPNITGNFDIPSYNTNDISVVSSGAFQSAKNGASARAIGYADQGYARTRTTIDASRSSSIYGNSTTVQAPATQMYLYFYVGEFTQTALENTAGLNTSLFNNKADLDASNFTSAGQAAIVAMGRNYTSVNITVATGSTGIAGTYDLSSYLGGDTTSIKIGHFFFRLNTSTNGFTSVALKSDVVTDAIRICGTNNYFASAGNIFIPFKKEVTLSFPDTSAGVQNASWLQFIGYM